MTKTNVIEARQGTYQLQIDIGAEAKAVWKTLVEETNEWWLRDFRMLAPDTRVSFDLGPGGMGLVEHEQGGGFLRWYHVQAYIPEQRKIYLVGHIASDFGGPSTSYLCLSVDDQETNSVFRLTDSLVGNVTDESLESLRSGWQALFGSLADYATKGSR